MDNLQLHSFYRGV